MGSLLARTSPEPPAFLRLAGHPLRWQLLSELARSDRRVGELTALLNQPQNTVSYHLARLRDGGLVSVRRSSADARDSYYRLDLARCGNLLAAAGAALHPALAPPPAPAIQRRGTTPVGVLFVCTGNSARSQLAEAMLQQAAGDSVTAVSAGSHPKPVHSYAVRAAQEYGIDLSARNSKHLDVFTGRRFDYVITLCDKVREVCPDFGGHPQKVHWSIPDPAVEGRYTAFRAVAADVHTRMGFLLATLAANKKRR